MDDDLYRLVLDLNGVQVRSPISGMALRYIRISI